MGRTKGENALSHNKGQWLRENKEKGQGKEEHRWNRKEKKNDSQGNSFRRKGTVEGEGEH